MTRKNFKSKRVALGRFGWRMIRFGAVAVCLAILITFQNRVAVSATPITFDLKGPYTTYAYPQSVATADFNADGKIDMAAACQTRASIRLGNGDGTFGPNVDYVIGNDGTSVAVADFNTDGNLDLVVSNGTSNTLSILPGNGTGGFGAKTDIAVGNSPQALVVRDFNGDTNNNVSILLGNGNGTFQARSNYAVAGQPYLVISDDFNNDGKADLATANYDTGNVSILLGNGDGTFGAKNDFPASAGPTSLDSADFDADGKVDLAVVDYESNAVSILLGNGNGTFGAKNDFATQTGPISVVVRDYTADGTLDLAVANETNDVSVFPGTGTGSFDPRTDIVAGNGPILVESDDFNADGMPDLAVVNYSGGSISVLINTSRPPVSVPICSYNNQAPGDCSSGQVGSILSEIQVDCVVPAGVDSVKFTLTSPIGDIFTNVSATHAGGDVYSLTAPIGLAAPGDGWSISAVCTDTLGVTKSNATPIWNAGPAASSDPQRLTVYDGTARFNEGDSLEIGSITDDPANPGDGNIDILSSGPLFFRPKSTLANSYFEGLWGEAKQRLALVNTGLDQPALEATGVGLDGTGIHGIFSGAGFNSGGAAIYGEVTSCGASQTCYAGYFNNSVVGSAIKVMNDSATKPALRAVNTQGGGLAGEFTGKISSTGDIIADSNALNDCSWHPISEAGPCPTGQLVNGFKFNTGIVSEYQCCKL
jgi:hypothetical protein